MDPCERHIEIVEQIDDLEERIRYLELADTKTSERLNNLIGRVERLVQSLERFMNQCRNFVIGASGTIILTLLGFLLWYIQKL